LFNSKDTSAAVNEVQVCMHPCVHHEVVRMALVELNELAWSAD
jgi:hypothetical protein